MWDQGTTARNVGKNDATDTNGLMVYARYKVCDKSVCIYRQVKVGLETEELKALRCLDGYCGKIN